MLFRLNCSRRGLTSGFSLIEIVLAIGIMSFALVAILGLFPIGLSTAAESKAETRIALIAQTLWAELQAGHDPASSPPSTALFTNAKGTMTQTIPLTTDGNVAIGFDDSGVVTGLIGNPDNIHPQSAFIARVGIDYQDPADPASEFPGLTRVDIVIEHPGAAPAAHRKSTTFVTLIRP